MVLDIFVMKPLQKAFSGYLSSTSVSVCNLQIIISMSKIVDMGVTVNVSHGMRSSQYRSPQKLGVHSK